MNPALSIITINFNNRDGLKKTIDSVICQTFKDFEWIVIDGGSTDGSKELIEQYSEHFSYWVSEPDKGAYNAMNKGIEVARGEYLSFMNSGDVYADDAVLKSVFDYTPNQDLVFGDWVLRYPEKDVRVTEPDTLSLHRLLFWSICHQAMFIKAQVLKTTGFDESYRIIADWKRWLEAIIGGCSSLYIPVLICIFDCSGISFNSGTLLEEEKKRLFEKDLAQFKTIRDFYLNKYKYPSLSMIFDLFASSKSNRRLIKFALKLIELKNKVFCDRVIK